MTVFLRNLCPGFLWSTTFCVTFCCSPLTMTLVLFIFTLMPLFSTKSFYSLSLLIRSSSVSAITTRSSAYSNSHGKATLNALDKASMTITNSKGLNAEPTSNIAKTKRKETCSNLYSTFEHELRQMLG